MSAIRSEIPPELLDAPVSDLDVVTIATKLKKWEELSAFLGLTHQDETDICRTYRDYSDQKRQALRRWREIKGKTATFRAFIAAATSISNIELVDSVKDMLRARQQPPRNGAPADVRVDQVNPRRDRQTTEVMLTINRDLLTLSGYLTPLSKDNMKVLGRLLGLRDNTVTNLFDGTAKGTYLDSILTAWLNQQDDVQDKGGPYWSVLIKALESSHLGHNGIAAQIRREQLHDN